MSINCARFAYCVSGINSICIFSIHLFLEKCDGLLPCIPLDYKALVDKQVSVFFLGLPDPFSSRNVTTTERKRGQSVRGDLFAASNVV